jgi:hypothetical protein
MGTARPRRGLRIVGSGRYTLTAGQTKVIKLTLNRTGKRLHFHLQTEPEREALRR